MSTRSTSPRRPAPATPATPAPSRRRLWQLAGVAGLAVVAVVVAIAISSSGGSSAASGGAAAPAVPSTPGAILDGISERNGVLGDPKAPVTVTEYVDLQCPICAQTAAQELPTVVRDYVATGKVKLQARLLHFIGPDSVDAARYAAAAARQDRFWPFLLDFYGAQGAENSGYVTPAFLAAVAKAAGVDAARAKADAGSAAAQAVLDRANAGAQRLGIDATPTFVVQRANGKLAVATAQQLPGVLAK
jgi:protein-disulfide isomerase